MLKDKVAVVTGGTRGIGYAVVKKFLSNGAKVALFGSKKETVDKALASLKAENAQWEVSGYYPNLMDADAVAETINKIKDEYGRIDILVNNAAWWKGEAFLSVTREDFRKGFSAYLESLYFLSQAAAKQMVEEKRAGKIVHIASTAAYYGERGMSVYCAAKAAVVNLTRAMALELGSYGICVNAAAPGTTVTDSEKRPDYVLESFRRMGALPKLNTAEKIAPAVLFLSSSDSDGITGETLVVDGGCVQIRMPEKLYEEPMTDWKR